MSTARNISIGLAGAALLAAGGGWIWATSFAGWARPEVVQPPAPGEQMHPVRIRPGPDTPTVLTSALSPDGREVAAACSTCHTTRPPDVETRDASALVEFHQGLAYVHGGQTCLSCHNATNYDTLRRADGSSVPYPRTIELCAQCHGPQYRDYVRGSHGGMTGHWDLRTGPRERNSCTDCHDPHAPAYPKVMPVFPPDDPGARQQARRVQALPPHE